MCKQCEKAGMSSDIMKKQGKAFGYPKCCIEQFISDVEQLHTDGEDSRIPARKIIGALTEGFVPCTTHAMKLMTGEIRLEELIKKRDGRRGTFKVHEMYNEFFETVFTD